MLFVVPSDLSSVLSPVLKRRLEAIRDSPAVLQLNAVSRGIEKECLRVQPDGNIAQTSHPTFYGSALTNPHITTDFSEALLEFITPVCESVEELMTWLREIHQYSYAGLDREYLWVSSMPCVLPNDEGIPVARYGSSNVGKMKTTYRLGLGKRYGRAMQTIAGIHYNFSFSDEFWLDYKDLLSSPLSLQDFKTEQYFHLIRNFHRYSWLLVYLFGASPALCKTFLGHDEHQLDANASGTLFAEHGTSLRMGDLGYQSSAQESLYVSYNNLAEYSETLGQALRESIEEYEKIGTHEDGQRIQLSTALLQIENEFYSSVRPKRVAQSGESPLKALDSRGVEYIEVRCLDVNPYLPLGIDEHQVRFIDSFLLFCLLEDSPPTEHEECEQISRNNKLVVNHGRDANTRLLVDGQEQSVHQAAENIFAQLESCAALFDLSKGSSLFSESVREQKAKVENNDLPSAQVLADLEQHEQSYFKFAMHHVREHAAWFSERPLTSERQQYFAECARQSIQQQHQVEAADELDFETFLADYYARM